MKQFDWKKILPYAVAIVAFVAVAMIYCAPLLEGKVLVQGDVNNWKGAAQEARAYYDANGTRTWWTNSMFGGMPTYQITGSLPSGEVRNGMAKIAHLGMEGGWEAIGIIFAYFFGFFLMLRCFKVNPWLSIIGGLAIGFSTYFFLIIPAGHVTKAVALGFLAPVIGGFYAIFRKQYWLGAPLIMLYGIMSINLHPQMTFYIFMLIGVLACAELYIHIKDKAWKDLGISLGVLALSLLLVVGTKVSWLEMNQSYLKETMRGGHSELTSNSDSGPTSNNNSGLSLDYATAWSYGVDETMTFLIPNWEGGASGYNVGENSQLYETIKKSGFDKRWAKQYCEHAPTYRGEKAFTSGPVYMGAIICFLFVLGLLIVPGPYKWALLIATLFSVALAWGRNMMWLTELFFNYFPMYNKFRAVESILVVAEITMPLLGILALQQIVDKKVAWEKLRMNMFIAGGITMGLCLFFALFAGVVDVTSSYDVQWKNQLFAMFSEAIKDKHQVTLIVQQFSNAILADRIELIKADAWRSFIFIALGFAVIYWYAWKSESQSLASAPYRLIAFCAALAALVLADMLPVNKRFFGNNHFVKAKDAEAYFAMQPYEQEILQDKDPNFRVLNLATNTFNDARTSYRLKSIGGYSAAKLRRYQDLIDEHISEEMNPLMQTVMRTQGFMLPDANEGKDFPVLNMLNMKYAIVPLQGGKQAPVYNPYAMGNCWFVDEVIMVDTPDEECAVLSTLDLHKQAVADKKFAEALDITKPEVTPLMAFDTTLIELTSYAPNCLKYEAMTERNKVAVFSEIYYPYDWHLYVVNTNGEKMEIPLARVNYTLRAAVIPAGHHQLIMEFTPHAVKTDRWCMVLMVLALLLSMGGLTYPLWKNKLCFNRKR